MKNRNKTINFYRQLLSFLLIAGLLAATSSCSTSSRITATWVNEDAQPFTFDKVAVVAMVPEKSDRNLIETELVEALGQHGIAATVTTDILPKADPVNGEEQKKALEEQVQTRFNDNRIDAMLIVALLGTETDGYFMSEYPDYAPTPIYGGYGSPYVYRISEYPYYNYPYYGFYSNYYSTLYDPAYYVNRTYYYTETSLFDVKSGKMIWTAQTETTDPVSMRKKADEFADLVISQMLSNRVVVPEDTDVLPKMSNR